MSKDYYTILGVGKDANLTAIKKAYRRLAIRCHPDRCPDDPSAKSRFIEISEAYEVLSDPEKREKFDRFGSDIFRKGGGTEDSGTYPRTPAGGSGAASASSQESVPFHDPFDLFRQVFGNTGGSQQGTTTGGSIFDHLFGGKTATGSSGRVRAGTDIQQGIEIEFSESILGTESKISFSHTISCPQCNGLGSDPGFKSKGCPVCGGTGKEQCLLNVPPQACPACRGTGQFSPPACRNCQGQGRIKEEKSLTITIPPGVDNGSRLKVSGEGDAAPRGGRPGDLYVTVKVKPHPFFRRDGLDVILDFPICYPMAVLGGIAEVPTIAGSARLKIPERTRDGTIMRLHGKGAPSLKGGKRGDQQVRLMIDIPRDLTEEQEEMLRQFAVSLGNTSVRKPDRDSWLRRAMKFVKRKEK
jgi:molecular chaperone DnaJ